MKVALGTVQFGLHYGIANSGGQVTDEQAIAILATAKAAGVDTLDTAIAYGTSESRLGAIGTTGWKIVSKLPALPQAVEDVGKWAAQQVTDSLARLQASRLDVLLLHRPNDLLGAHGRAYRKALEKLRADGQVLALGYSIYSPDELTALFSFMKPDIVQAPFNIIDRRLLVSGWLDRLANQDIRVHTRSAFMQGLLLMPDRNRPPWFDRWKNLLNRWTDACTEFGDALPLSLGYCLSFPQIERVVVGVDNVQQLRQILVAAETPVIQMYPDVESSDLDLIEPSRWKII